MQFSVNKEDFLRVLSPIAKVVSKTPSMPILSCVLLEVKGGHLIITSSDLEVMMRGRLECSGEDCGVCVDAKLLQDFVKLSNKSVDTVEFTIEDTDVVRVSVGRSKCSISGFSSSEFPAMDVLKGNEQPVCSLESVPFQEGISRVLYATSNDDLRPVMMGVNLLSKKKVGVLATTNGHVLSTYRVDCDGDLDITIPKKAAQSLSDSTLTTSDVIRLYKAGRNYGASLGDYMLYFRVIDGAYPNYDAVIPCDNPISVSVNRVDLLDSMKRVGLFANQSTNQISMLFQKEGGVLLKCSDIDYGKTASESVDCKVDGCESIEIGFNSRLLSATLSNMDSEVLTIEMSAPNRAALIHGSSGVHMGLVMPVMIG